MFDFIKQIYTAEPSASNNTRIWALKEATQVFVRWCYSDEIFTNPSVSSEVMALYLHQEECRHRQRDLDL